MKIVKSLFPIIMLAIAVAYWIQSKPKNEIDFASNARLERQKALIQAPDIKTLNRDREFVSLSDLKGRPVLLNFWASWCPPCEEELPSFAAMANLLEKTTNIKILAVSVDTDWAPIDGLFKKLKLTPTFLITLSPDSKAAETYAVDKFPETLLIDASQKVVRRFNGAQNWMDPEILAYLESQSTIVTPPKPE